MFSKVINNTPNVQNKKINKVDSLERFKNLNKQVENVNEIVNPITSIDNYHTHVTIPKKQQELVVEQEENSFGEKYFTMLTGKKKEKKTQTPELENITNLTDNGKHYKLDTMTTIYIGSISVIALYIVYRAIRKTI